MVPGLLPPGTSNTAWSAPHVRFQLPPSPSSTSLPLNRTVFIPFPRFTEQYVQLSPLSATSQDLTKLRLFAARARDAGMRVIGLRHVPGSRPIPSAFSYELLSNKSTRAYLAAARWFQMELLVSYMCQPNHSVNMFPQSRKQQSCNNPNTKPSLRFFSIGEALWNKRKRPACSTSSTAPSFPSQSRSSDLAAAWDIRSNGALSDVTKSPFRDSHLGSKTHTCISGLP